MFVDENNSTTCKRHVGADEKQNPEKDEDGENDDADGEEKKAGTKSNSGKVHRQNLEAWLARDEEPVDYSGIGDHWVLTTMMNGCNATMSANIARDFFSKYPMDNSNTIPISAGGMSFISFIIFS